MTLFLGGVGSFPGGSDGKESVCSAGDLDSITGPGRIPAEGNGNLSVFLPGEFHGQRSLVGYTPWGCKESDTTEQLTPVGTYWKAGGEVEAGWSSWRLC